MAVTILSESYGPRKPFVTCTAASLSELADYVGLWAEGSEATISATKYVLDKTNGWVLPGQSGKELPAVTAEDDGDVLTVVSGAWAKAAPSGGGSGGGLLKVTLSGDYLTADKTAGEIYAAMSNGDDVVFYYAFLNTPPDDVPGEATEEAYVEKCISAVCADGVGYYFYTWNISPNLFAETENDYPEIQGGHQ